MKKLTVIGLLCAVGAMVLSLYVAFGLVPKAKGALNANQALYSLKLDLENSPAAATANVQAKIANIKKESDKIMDAANKYRNARDISVFLVFALAGIACILGTIAILKKQKLGFVVDALGTAAFLLTAATATHMFS
ncbi:MAG: hypothetical protein LDLANPLL_01583 [Turneriella sp.]|nr:hypothetical protein [Turneriella sp.]